MIGLKLKHLREKRGLSQDKLGAISGLTGGHIGTIERGEAKNVGVETLGKIADALGVDLAYFFPPKKSPRTRKSCETILEEASK